MTTITLNSDGFNFGDIIIYDAVSDRITINGKLYSGQEVAQINPKIIDSYSDLLKNKDGEILRKLELN